MCLCILCIWCCVFYCDVSGRLVLLLLINWLIDLLLVWGNYTDHILDLLQRGRATLWALIIHGRLCVCVQWQQDHWQTNHSQHTAPLGRHGSACTNILHTLITWVCWPAVLYTDELSPRTAATHDWPPMKASVTALRGAVAIIVDSNTCVTQCYLSLL